MTFQQANEHDYDHDRDFPIKDFEERLAEYTITAPDPPLACGRAYVRVSKLSEWLKSEVKLPNNNTTTQASRLLEYAYQDRRDKGHARPITREKLLVGEKCCALIFCILVKIGWGELIHLFRKREEADRHLPIPLSTLKTTFGNIREVYSAELSKEILDPGKLAEIFDKEQWQFCPAKFDLQEYPDFHEKRIIPILRKEKINGKGGTATLWQIEVLAEFVEDELGKVMASSLYDNPKDNLGPRYHFALKVFNAGNRSIYENEIDAFTALRKHGGMVQCLGGYSHREIHHTVTGNSTNVATEGKTKVTDNILLEYGDRDLEELFAARLPPVLPEEIEAFWIDLFEVAHAVKGIHHFKINYDGVVQEYFGWHADIKPDNILEIQKKFKLADPGFAKFLKKVKAESESNPTANLRGGTHTFGAPECHPARKWRGAVDQTIDNWSLGCVFSIAATWVVLGWEGGVRMYNKVREQAITRRIKEQQSHSLLNPAPPMLELGDYFHDGLSVLHEVSDWHKYLRISLRKTDRITSQVLDLVDEYLLVGNPESRARSSIICEKLIAITQGLKTLTAVVPGVPKTIVQILHDIDENIPTHATDRSATNLTTVDPVSKTFHDRQIRKENNLKLPLMQTTHRSYRKSSMTDGAFLNTSSRVTADKGENTLQTTRISSHKSPQEIGIQVPQSTSIFSKNTIPEKTHSSHDGNTTQLPQTTPIVPSLADLIAPFTQQEPSLIEPQDVNQARKEVERRVSRSSMVVKVKRALGFRSKQKDDLLARYYQDRDIKFLVDNGESMEKHWAEASRLLETLLMKADGLDEDGVDLYFTQGSVKATNARKIHKIMEKMRHLEAIPRVGVHTDIRQRFQVMFDDYIRDAKTKQRQGVKPKNLTIIVLTDGIWNGTGDKDDLNRSIINFANNLAGIMGRPLTDRLVSIQFIQFGNDADARYRLKILDDELVYDGIPDLIDTEPCNGDVNKMLLGSFVEMFDLIPDTATTTIPADTSRPISPRSYRPSSQQMGETSATNTSSFTGQPTRINLPATDRFTASDGTYSHFLPGQLQRTSPPAMDGFIPGAPGRSQTNRTEYTPANNGQREGQQHTPPPNTPQKSRLPKLPTRFRSVG